MIWAFPEQYSMYLFRKYSELPSIHEKKDGKSKKKNEPQLKHMEVVCKVPFCKAVKKKYESHLINDVINNG